MSPPTLTDRLSSRWSEPGGLREVWLVAYPLIISTSLWSVLMLVDRMFLFWYDKSAMAAALPAGMLHWTSLGFFFGTAGYVNSFVAQYHGAKRPDRISAIVAQGGWFSIASIPFFLAMIPLAPLVFAASMEPNPADPLEARKVYEAEVVYFQTLAWGGGAMVLATAVSSFFTGLGKTALVMWVNVLVVGVNIALDYFLIFGVNGWFAWGAAGAGVATSVSHWFKAFVLIGLLFLPMDGVRYPWLSNWKPDRALFMRLLRYGAPSGLQFFIEGLALSVIVLLIGLAGPTALAATTMAFNVNAIAFIPMIGISIAVSTLVGQNLGENKPEIAARATWNSLIWAVAITLVFAFGYLVFPDLFMIGHKFGADPEDFAEVRDLTVILLRFVALFCLFDALNIVLIGALKGAGDTKFILLAAVVMTVGGMAGGLIGGAFVGTSIYWWWWFLTLWILVQCVVHFLRFLGGKWRTMRVIESEFLPSEDGGEKPVLAPVADGPARLEEDDLPASAAP
ncbi:MAG TPA: MATE family efflux transporter [Pirellulaceae bacterium]|jgi:MATE family multidrug resistance protein|nr:MATE family efflux transporter [Pirellulaceae bacterium]